MKKPLRAVALSVILALGIAPTLFAAQETVFKLTSDLSGQGTMNHSETVKISNYSLGAAEAKENGKKTTESTLTITVDSNETKFLDVCRNAVAGSPSLNKYKATLTVEIPQSKVISGSKAMVKILSQTKFSLMKVMVVGPTPASTPTKGKATGKGKGPKKKGSPVKVKFSFEKMEKKTGNSNKTGKDDWDTAI